MTTLGAALYFGFFAAAALWLFLTGDRPAVRGTTASARPRSGATG